MNLITCPQCGLQGQVPAGYADTNINCPQCQTLIEIGIPPGVDGGPPVWPEEPEPEIPQTTPPRASVADGAVLCPHCRGAIEQNDGAAGQTLACPHCDKSFRMPDPSDDFVKSFRKIFPDQDKQMIMFGGSVGKVVEPWYYRFIEIYAKVWMWYALLFLGGSGVAAVIYGLRIMSHSAGSDITVFVIGLGILMMFGFFVLVQVLLTVAFMLLAVDAARNLRALQDADSRKAR